MRGVLVNALAIVLASCIGVFLKKKIAEQYKQPIVFALGLCTLIVGLNNALKSKDFLVIALSMTIGTLIGEFLNLERQLERIGSVLEKRLSKSSDNFVKGFVSASIIYCVGAMAILGSLESGLTGNYEILYTKAVLDGIFSLIYSAGIGIGVAFSSVSVIMYQGALVLTASFIKPFLTEVIISQMTAVGGLLIIGIGLNLLEIKKLRLANMLPGIFLPLVYGIVKALFF